MFLAEYSLFRNSRENMFGQCWVTLCQAREEKRFAGGELYIGVGAELSSGPFTRGGGHGRTVCPEGVGELAPVPPVID